MLDSALRDWLNARGYRLYTSGIMRDIYSALYQRCVTDVPPCDSNGKTHIDIWVSDVLPKTSPTLTVAICAESAGRWYRLEAYGIPQTTEAVLVAEEHVTAAWRAVAGDK